MAEWAVARLLAQLCRALEFCTARGLDLRCCSGTVAPEVGSLIPIALILIFFVIVSMKVK